MTRQYVVDSRGDKVSVILSIEEYRTLLEDLADLAAVAERRAEPSEAHGDVVERLRVHGAL